MRLRWKVFVLAVCEELKRDPTLSPKQVAAIVGPKMGWFANGVSLLSPAAAARKAERYLGNGEITFAIRKVMGMAGINVVDTFKKLKDLMDSEDENVALSATRTTLSYAMPKPTKQVQIDQRTLVKKIEVRDEPPVIRARTIEVLPGGTDAS
jgi:hypothetical protein